MPECAYLTAHGHPLDYQGYTTVLLECPAGYENHEILADCLTIAVTTGASFFFSLIVAPLLLLGGSRAYIRMTKKKAMALEDEIMEESLAGTVTRVAKKKAAADKAHKTKSKAEGKYDDVRVLRDMYSEDLR